VFKVFIRSVVHFVIDEDCLLRSTEVFGGAEVLRRDGVSVWLAVLRARARQSVLQNCLRKTYSK
jgi:hypothetical protein